MTDLQDLIKLWFYNSSHTKSWHLNHLQFVSKEFHWQKGYVNITHDGIECAWLNQYGGGQYNIKAADPEFFDRLDIILKETLL